MKRRCFLWEIGDPLSHPGLLLSLIDTRVDKLLIKVKREHD